MGAFGKAMKKFIDQEIIGGAPSKKKPEMPGETAGSKGPKPTLAGTINAKKNNVNALLNEAEAELNSQNKQANRPRK